ncbi:acetylornithine transaminase [Enterococcus columbae]|uniref:Acetylornithine aminotransferase n=1 Tax=Enterococcus columbae DSM 7374 = ATCC 51263 TaxID=1121865 RepID=S0KYS3_9ENTE|nr:acetylornithine transaminase [Enterococcus columbae]EOT44406.1 hypothetical protein OMW_00462 [Enterococcus columbae DSM 7374 = ATCC 51263]EOW84564.1 hypothetical protein I568_01060 [Enterococcus columbae DSM 7374 = ATCC 51263]OJG22524.1 hypothetical protein RR47_GL000963 [Enterococcus columbae DSM 7374 = ATCC 51263]
MTFLFPNYQRKPIELVSGKGCMVTDQSGKQYLDLTSGIGVSSLGHQHPLLTKALKQQVDKIWHTSNLYTNSLQEAVAEKLANHKDYVAFFCNSGTEANEAALKLAKKATGRNKILSFHQSFHGRTYGAMSLTGQSSIQQGFGEMLGEVAYFPFNDIEEIADNLNQEVAAVIVELIQGESGIHVAYKGWIKELYKLCKKQGILFIVDEVQTGIGRTGSLFAYEQYDIEPDIITSAKALANGLPLGAMLGKQSLAQTFSPGSHGSTFGGNPLALSVACQVLDLVQTPEIQENIQQRSLQFFNGLQQISSKKIIDIRGKGLMIGIELTDSLVLTQVMNQLEKHGVLTLRAGKNVLRLLPPLTISQAEVAKALEIIEEVLAG